MSLGTLDNFVRHCSNTIQRMKLWVDDIRNAPDDSWTVARTVTSAIRAIARYDFDTISLDHDISHQVTVGALGRPYPCEETFASVAYFIAAKYVNHHDTKKPKVTLHTSNTVAGDEMAQILYRECGIEVEKKYMGAANRLEMEV